MITRFPFFRSGMGLVLSALSSLHVTAAEGLPFSTGLDRSRSAPRSRSLPHLSLSPVTISGGFTVGLSLPVGGFGDNEHEAQVKAGDAGFAGVGFSGTVRYFAEFGTTPLGWTLDASLILNSLDDNEFEDAMRSEYYPLLPEAYDLDVTASLWWITVPILTGPALHFVVMPGFGLRASGLMGLAIVRPADIEVVSDNASSDYTHETVASFCGGFEAGLEVNGFLMLCRGVFSRLENVDAEENLDLGGLTSHDDYTRDFSMAIVQLAVGYRF